MGLYGLNTLKNHQIRLLRVALEDGCKIRCEITIHDLGDGIPEFSALSYTWGPCHPGSCTFRRPQLPTASHRIIVCNDEPKHVEENLYDFLCHRVLDSADSTYLWIDALCIDQNNIAEKSDQVKIMGEIYIAARRVLIWLGPEDSSTCIAYDHMQDMTGLESEARIALHPHEVSMHNTNPLLDLSRWKALSHFFNRNWFRRTWIIQEAVFAKSCNVICGSLRISWDTLVEISRFLATSNWTTFLKDPTYFEDTTNQWHNTPARLAAQHKTWKGSYKDGLLYALIRARPSICWNARDKVYSQLHLGQAQIFPNYRLSVAEVYTIAAEYILKQSGSMLLLTCVEGEEFQTLEHALPSWVPDWSVPKFTGLRMTGYRHFNAAGYRPPIYSISDSRKILRVEAVKVDDIEEIGVDKVELRANLPFSDLWQLTSGLNSTCTNLYDTQSSGEIVWRSLMTNRGSTATDHRVLYPAPERYGHSFRDWILWRYAQASGTPAAFPIISENDSFLPTRQELEGTRKKAAHNAAYQADLARKASLFDLNYSHAMLQRPFKTKQGYFGIGTRCLRKEDSLWIVSGCRVPLILRPVKNSEHYRLVGGSYTHGLMDGEGLQGENVKFEMVNLEIRKFPSSGLRKLPDGEIISEVEFNNPLSFLQPWGFTIYRTYYGPGSDQQWDELIQAITNGAKDAARGNAKPTDDPAIIAKVEELFKLDIRSNSAVLDGLTLEEVRQLYHNGTGGQPMNTDKDPWRIFMLADTEVLANPDLAIIKCVAADYDAAACVPKNPRFGPQRYFGWLRMSSNHVLKLWSELEIYLLEQIVNHTAGGPGAWWDPDDGC